MVFVSDRQRRGFFATGNFKRQPRGSNSPSTFFSYKDGRKLGKFQSIKKVFKKFPSERKAFNKVKKFNKRTGSNVTTTKQIMMQKKTMKISKRWDR